jgi:acetate kinase
MTEALLVLNSGSSSLKFALFLPGERLQPLLRGQFEALGTRPRFIAHFASGDVDEQSFPERPGIGHREAVDFLLSWGRSGRLADHRIVATGHRIVHGGMRFDAPSLITPETLGALDALVPLAPLHQPHGIEVIRCLAELAPELPQVACFDTAFHLQQPAVAQSFALPKRYLQEGVRRYGFHGLSFEYVATVLKGTDPRAHSGRTVIAHLGNGASMCALRGGRSVATTMGFTALDGLPMGTRCGAIDPGVLLYLMDHHGMDARDLEHLLYEESGLLGVSGVSSDMRDLLASADPRAGFAVDLFVYRIGRELGSLASALGGLDALVFTGGIGENAATIRARVCRDAAWLGVELDDAANAGGGPRISRGDGRVSAWVIATNEERMIAEHMLRVLG